MFILSYEVFLREGEVEFFQGEMIRLDELHNFIKNIRVQLIADLVSFIDQF